MRKFREIKSPVALAVCGIFLVPEPIGICLVLAAAIWWLWRKAGCDFCNTILLSWSRRVVQTLCRLRVNWTYRGKRLEPQRQAPPLPATAVLAAEAASDMIAGTSEIC
jgi:hypothetical protein